MDLILLPGSNLHNKEWIEEVEASLKPSFNKTTIQYYKHWGGGDVDLDYELKVLQKTAHALKENSRRQPQV